MPIGKVGAFEMFIFWIIVSIIAGVLIGGFLLFWIVIREVQRVEAGE